MDEEVDFGLLPLLKIFVEVHLSYYPTGQQSILLPLLIVLGMADGGEGEVFRANQLTRVCAINSHII